MPTGSCMNNRNFWLFLFCFLSFSACKEKVNSSGKVKKVSYRFLENKLAERELIFDWFSSKVRVNYNDAKQSQSFTANVRLKKDSIIWMSLTGPLGIEGGRVVITADSLKIIDRLNRRFYLKPLKFLENYVPFAFNLKDIQEILVGNRILKFSKKESLKISESHYLLEGEENGFELSILVRPIDYTFSEMRLKYPVQNQDVLIKFENYKEFEEKPFAFERFIDVKSGDQVANISMNFSRVKIDQDLKFPFDAPGKEKYEWIE